MPSIVVIDQSGKVRYLYSGKDVADRPRDEEVLAALDGLDRGIERLTGGPEFQVGASAGGREQRSPSAARHGIRAAHFLLSGRLLHHRDPRGEVRRVGPRRKAGARGTGLLPADGSSYIEALEETIRLR